MSNNNDIDQLLSASAANGLLDFVQFLVSKGANIHANNDDAIRVSAKHGHLEIVKFLMAKGADGSYLVPTMCRCKVWPPEHRGVRGRDGC